MSLTGKQKACGAVLGLGVLALFVDKTFLAPEESGAAQYAVVQSAVIAAPQTSAKAIALLASENQLAAQLNAIAETRQFDIERMPDAFAPPTWASVQRLAELGLDIHSLRADNFDGHRLMAVMASSDGGSVIVDRKALGIGDTLDRFTLVSVTDGAATFSVPGSSRLIEVRVEGRD